MSLGHNQKPTSSEPFQVMAIKSKSQTYGSKTNQTRVLIRISKRSSSLKPKKIRTMTGLGSSCGACKFLRRRCTSQCVFAPYFCYEEAAAHFAAVHKVFGASNVSKLLSNLPMNSRSEAAVTISYEALARMQDPVYGCVAQIFQLQQQVASLQEEIETLENEMANIPVNVSSFGSSQATDNLNGELQAYVSLQPPLCSSHEVNTSANHAIHSQMNVQIPTIYGLEDQNSVPCSGSGPLERHFEGMDQGIFASYPWIDNWSNIN